MEALARSVGRNGHRSFVQRVLRRHPRYREDFNAIDFRDRGEDVWRALRF